jgi:hypothetical protein
MTPIRGHGIGDRVVEQAVESVELVDGDRRTLLLCQLGNGLADITITVDHLIHGVSLREQLCAVQGGSTAALHRTRRVFPGAGNQGASRLRACLVAMKRLDQLLEE